MAPLGSDNGDAIGSKLAGNSRRTAGLDPAVLVVLVAFVGYFGVARALGNFYPFSTFPMYSQDHTTSASRIVARDAHGALTEVSAFDPWHCARPIDPRASSCPSAAPFYLIGYLDREAAAYVTSHTSAEGDGEPVDVVRHIWRFSDTGNEVRTEDCVLATCRARRR